MSKSSKTSHETAISTEEKTQTSPVEKFENENFSVQLTKEPGCVIDMYVTIRPKAIEAAKAKAAKNINKEVSIPGFRKGKAPEALIADRYKSQIEQEWRDLVTSTSFSEACKLINIFPDSNDSFLKVSCDSLSITEGAKLHYRFETSPVMDVIEPKDLIIEDVEQQEVSEEDIENVVEDFLLRESTWTPVEGRGAKDGDFVEVDIDIVSEPARNVCTNEKMKIEPKMMPKWLTKLLHGMKPGETKEGETEDENPSHQDECHDEKCTDKHHHHKHDFKPANVRVHLHLIQQPVKPALDDEFVKKYGAENVEDLRAKVKISLENKAAGAKRDRQRALMQQALLAKYRFEIPASRLKSDIKARTEQSIQELMQHAKEHGGYDDEKIAAEKKMIALFHEERCKEEFRLILLLSQVLRRNQLKVTPEEVNMKYLESLWMQRMGADIHLSEKEQEAKSQIEMKLSMERALDFLIDFTR